MPNYELWDQSVCGALTHLLLDIRFRPVWNAKPRLKGSECMRWPQIKTGYRCLISNGTGVVELVNPSSTAERTTRLANVVLALTMRAELPRSFRLRPVNSFVSEERLGAEHLAMVVKRASLLHDSENVQVRPESIADADSWHGHAPDATRLTRSKCDSDLALESALPPLTALSSGPSGWST